MTSPPTQAPPAGQPPVAPGRERRTRALAALLAVVVAAGALVAVVVILTRSHPAKPPGPAGTTPPASAGGPSATPVVGIKPPMQGIVAEDPSLPKDELAGLLGGMVVIAPWSELQPVRNGPIVANNVIDRAVQTARTFNAAHPRTPVYVKIRLFAGIGAPEWAKTLDGFRPVELTNIQSGRSGTVGPFWTASYGAAYADLQRKLAARYDLEPLIRDVTISRCMTVFAEPFQRDVRDAAEFLRQGYSVDADQACLRDQVDAHAVWKHTHQSLSFNPYKPWQPGQTASRGQLAGDIAFPVSVMEHCRAVLGVLCTLENNSIRAAYVGLQKAAPAAAKPQLRQYGAMYAELARRGPALTLQTAGPKAVGDLHATVQWAVSLGANSVEVPKVYDPTAMRADNAALLANPVGGGR